MARFFRQLGGWLIGVGALGIAGLAVLVAFIAAGHSAPQSAKPAAPTPSAPVTAVQAAAMPPAPPVGFQPNSVSFVSADEGWALGTLLPCEAPACPMLQHTVDGGHTWKPIAISQLPIGPGTLAFTDARNGSIAVPRGQWSTHDGGVTWHQTGPPSSVLWRYVGGTVRLTSANNELLTSFDGGRHWVVAYTGAEGAIFEMSGFASASEGFAIEIDPIPGAGSSTSSRLLMSRDSGQTWVPVSFSHAA